ncbi:linker for activation of T-cells family member 2 isoform X1 [Camelus bactrianus]|uniref:Linker for activation of T-cells family member 2 isoform X1 n=1 Tax=Camelus bactrianus TaxID=9837 RepID=A0AC58NW88_CAMBA
MGTETELLWPGAALLLLLGLAAGLCARCSRPGAKKSEKIYEQRSLQENQQSFAVARTYTLVREAWPGTPVGTSSGAESARKDKLLRFSPSLEDPSSPRYQNFSKGSRHRSDAAYIDPITMDYYNWGQLQKPLEDDDDTNSYENVLICKQNKTESEEAPSAPGSAGRHSGDPPSTSASMRTQADPLEGRPWHLTGLRTGPGGCPSASPSPGVLPAEDEGSEDYQNSASIRQWRESKRVVEPVLREAPPSLAGSPDEDSGEPDYVNGDVAATKA